MAAPRERPRNPWLAHTLTLLVAGLAIFDLVWRPPLDDLLLGALVSLIWFWAGVGVDRLLGRFSGTGSG